MTARSASAAFALGFVLVLTSVQSARADDTVACGQTLPADPKEPYKADLLGDLGGVRPAIEQYGLTFALSETSEILGNPTGGTKQGAIYEGLTDASLALNLRPYFNWPGVFCVRAYQIHGRGLTTHDINNLMTVSSIEATPATRLLELWYEQWIDDWLRIRIGQQGADQDFIVSPTARLFVNSTFGWPSLPGSDLPSGGPAYPLSTPGVRVHIKVNEAVSFFAGLFNGDPAGPGLGDPQKRDASGTAFRINDGAFALFEARYRPGESDDSAIYKIGAWFNSEKFSDQHFDSNGVSLASPLSNGMPRLLGNDYSVYGIVDQPLYSNKDSGQNLSVFLRAMGAPGDRNLVSFYFDTGLAFSGPFGRQNDTVGIGFAYAQIGNAARMLDRDTAAITPGYPVRSREAVLELTYQMQVTDWWQLQPDFQYVVAPNGGVPNPNRPGQKIGNAAVLGLRSAITF